MYSCVILLQNKNFHSLLSDGIVDAFYGPTHDRARSRGARRGTLQHLCMERSDRSGRPVRPVAVQNDDDPTNARSGGTPSGQARVGLP